MYKVGDSDTCVHNRRESVDLLGLVRLGMLCVKGEHDRLAREAHSGRSLG
jgi:hypothetical protein